MPNHVSHRISFSKDCDNLAEALEAVKTINKENGQETNYFDLDKIIPEPEELKLICYPHDLISLAYYLTNRGINKLSRVDLWRYNPKDDVVNFDKTVEELGTVIQQYDDFGRIKDSVLPIYSNFFKLPDTLDELYQSGKAVVLLRDRHKFKNWYDAHCKIWGTKWNSYSTFYDERGLMFDTAWGSPTPVIMEFAKKFNLTMTVQAFDEGHNFWYIQEFENGVPTSIRSSLKEDKAEIYLEVYGIELDEDEDEAF